MNRTVSRFRRVIMDPQESREFVGELYGTGLTLAGAADRSRPTVLDGVHAGPVSFVDADIPFDGSYDVVGQGSYVFATLLSGSASFRHGQAQDRFGPGDTYLALEPEGEARDRAWCSHSATASLTVGLFAEVSGLDPEETAPGVRFTSREPVIGGARRWRDAVGFVRHVVDEAEPTSPELLLGPAARLLAATALSVFPNTAVAEHPGRDGRDAHPVALRRATAFIDASPDLDITIVDIARAACITPRGVQLAFRRHLDTTPTAYLRRVRLQHAHRQLVDAVGGDGSTVGRIALEWGFASPSRFAGYYRAEFGCPPSETLAR